LPKKQKVKNSRKFTFKKKQDKTEQIPQKKQNKIKYSKVQKSKKFESKNLEKSKKNKKEQKFNNH